MSLYWNLPRRIPQQLIAATIITYYLFPNRAKEISIYIVQTGSLMTEINFH